MVSRKRNDAEARALRRFCYGWAPSAVDKHEGKPSGFTHDAVVKWWAADKDHHGVSLENYLGRSV